MRVEQPIFIFGTGRSGTTIFHRMFAEHPNIAWFSVLSNIYPDKPFINRYMRAVTALPVLGGYVKRKLKPAECYNFWEYYCKGFSSPCRDLLPGDVTDKTRKDIQTVLAKMVTTKRSRLLSKLTGWPRIGFLHEIFNDAKFIHIIRDGRAVANSLINVPWWDGWRGPEGWRYGELTPLQRAEWEKFDKSFIALAGINWKILMDAAEKAKAFISQKNLLEIRYEDLCSNPTSVFKNVIMFCDLEWSSRFEASLAKYPLKDANDKWKKELTVGQQRILEVILRDHLKKYDYNIN